MRVWALVGTVIAALTFVGALAHARATAAPVLTPISAKFDEQRRATVYTVDLKSANGQVLLADSYTWKLQPASDDPTCDEFGPSTTKPNEATWFHADSDGCTHKGIDHAGAVISVTVKHDEYTCMATYEGSNTGTGPPSQGCVSSARSCVAERAAVAKWASTVEQLEKLLAEAKVARRGAELTLSQATRELDKVIEEGTGFWDKIAGGGAYRNRYDAAAAALSNAEKALVEIKSRIRDLERELREALRALAKAERDLQACSRTTYAFGGAAACEAQARTLAAAKAAQGVATRVRVRLGSPAARARAALHAGAVLLSKPTPGLPAGMRSDIARAADKARASERSISKLVTGLSSEVTAAQRKTAVAAAKLKACQQG